jgi:hypothetical protein
MAASPRRRSVAPTFRRRFILAAPLTVALVAGVGAGIAQADPPDQYYLVGVPNVDVSPHSGAGAVDYWPNETSGAKLTESGLGLSPAGGLDGAAFGTAVLSSDLNFDGHDDLIVGAPGTGVGRIDVIFGSATGFTPAGAQILSASSQSGARFGAALAISGRRDREGDDAGTRDLWVGAPGYDVNEVKDAGAIFRFSLSPSGVATYLETITQDSPLVPGVAEAGDHFGAVLAGQVANGVVIGVPDEDIGTLKDAGTVQRLRTDPGTDALIQATDVNQNSAGVPGTAEAGDRFGAALSTAGHAVGVPGEDIGKLKDAGLVQTFGGNSSDMLVPSVDYTQDTPGIPGTAEAGDRFGAAISEGIFQCNENVSAAIGAPGEDIGRIKDAGSVTQIILPALSGLKLSQCPAQAFSQGSGLPGKAEAGDQVGAAMGERSGDPESEEDRMDRMLTGVPGEDVGAFKDTGRVYAFSGKFATTLTFRGGSDRTGLRFGSVFGTFVE